MSEKPKMLWEKVQGKLKNRRDLEAASTTDVMTGLLNRGGFYAHALSAINRADHAQTQLALLFLDLDGLKNINDTFGHAAGDLAIKETAALIKEHIREGDAAAHPSGDEYLVLLEDTTEEGAKLRAANIRNSIATRAIRTEKGTIHLKASIGVAVRDKYQSIDELVRKADAAMYIEKNGGRTSTRRKVRKDPFTKDIFDNEDGN